DLAASALATQVSDAIKDPISFYQNSPELARIAVMELDYDTLASLWLQYSATPGSLLPLLRDLDPYDVARGFDIMAATETQGVVDLLRAALADTANSGEQYVKDWLLRMLPEWSGTSIKTWYTQVNTDAERDSLAQDLLSTFSEYNKAVFLSTLAATDSARLLDQLDNVEDAITILAKIANSLSAKSAAAILAALPDLKASQWLLSMEQALQQQLLSAMEAIRGARILDKLDTDEAINQLESLTIPSAADILANMNTAVSILSRKLSDPIAAKWLAAMKPKEAAHLLDQMDAEEAAQIVAKLKPDQQRLIFAEMNDPQAIKDILKNS
ncbi:MAG: hypothetical protein AAFZ92_08640, partial [Pseudomonadota bacterium]